MLKRLLCACAAPIFAVAVGFTLMVYVGQVQRVQPITPGVYAVAGGTRPTGQLHATAGRACAPCAAAALAARAHARDRFYLHLSLFTL
jgi:hypothetical protein